MAEAPEERAAEGWKEPEIMEPEEETMEVGTVYDVGVDQTFFSRVPLLVGEIMTLRLTRAGGGAAEEECESAFLIKAWEKKEDGVWVQVKPLGCTQDWAWQECVSNFSRKKLKVHICKQEGGHCTVPDQPGLHVHCLRVYPVGALPGDYIDKKRMKEWEEFLKEVMVARPPEAEEDTEMPEVILPPGGPERPFTDRVEKLRRRLADVRGRMPEGGGETALAAHPAGGRARSGMIRDGGSLRGGGPWPDPRGRVQHGGLRQLKQEPQEISSEEEKTKKDALKKKSVGTQLLAAIEQKRRSAALAKKSKASSNKKSFMVKKKKKKKKNAKTSSSSSGTTSSSSSSGMLPPLQKKSKRRPGSVLEMLMSHVTEALADSAVTGGGSEGSQVLATGKLMSYYQILVRPQLMGKTRDLRELETTARALDMLMAGGVEEMADILAGRFIAIETAGISGSWVTAQHLEVAPSRTPGVAQAPLLLSAQRHLRLVERASGRGSWQGGKQQGGWWSESRGGAEGQAAGGRGKGKSGKAKSKGKKGKKSAWTDAAKPKENEEGQAT